MLDDEDLCLCFHVTRRKVMNYLRVEKPRAASQLSECYGAGAGCGWCRPFLKKLFEASRASENVDGVALPDSQEYAASRGEYVKNGEGTPPS